MQASDILWGGNNKCEVILSKNISLQVGSLVDLSYDYIQERYVLKYSGDSTWLSTTSDRNKELLDNIFLCGSSIATLARVIDIDEDNCILEIKVFESMTYFNSLQSIKICIDEKVISKLRVRERENPIEYLKNAFMYKDMVFIKGYGRNGSNFTLLSKERALNIIQENRVYTATNINRYDRSRADLDAVHILRGNVEFVNSSQNAVISRQVSSKMNEIASSSDYFDIWEAYNDLEKLFNFKKATETGILGYLSYTCELTDAFEYCFTLVGDNFEGFPDDTQIDCTADEDIKKLDQFKNAKQVQSLKAASVGTFLRIENGKCYVIDRRRSSQTKLPSQGYLFYSIAGDSVRLFRREAAKKTIINHEAPISNLSVIIDKGVGSDKQFRNEAPITKMLQRKFEKYNFNEQQRKAIEVAINTPDIALVLGPPGTGKTTVIKAIVTRFEEYFKKHNDNAMPSVLVTSFQHEAVENAILGLDGNGLPPNRIGGKRDEESKQAENIRAWRDSVTEKINQRIAEYGIEVDQSKEALRDKIYVWVQKGKDAAEGIALLREAYQGNRLKISLDLNEDINKIIAKSKNVTVDSVSLYGWEEDEQEEIKNILYSQRLTQVAYEDDGKKQVYALKFAIIQALIDNDGDTQFIDDILTTKGKDEEKFEIYVRKVEEFRSKYIKKAKDAEIISDVVTIEHCLKRLDAELNKSYLESIENRDEALAYILNQYLEAIQDEMEVAKIVEKFSNINAATCQQSMEVGRHSSNMVYDLVIVDEAARANPLDLLIPMSMGKQIILVGDHKQLPHMLDPEVTKQFEDDKRLNELGILKVSLFERMFNIFEKQESNIKRTTRLNKQYRMNSAIGEFASENFYKDYPLDSSEVDDILKQANIDMYNNKPMAWINADKNGYGMEEGKRSKSRYKEAVLVIDEVRKVLKADSLKSIGVITFYKRQMELMQSIAQKVLTEDQLFHVSIGTVDAFQGKEFDVVYLSCVRANTKPLDDMRNRVGHISDLNRLCVSFTRSKQLLVVVGDRETVECVPSLSEFIKKCTEEGIGYYE